MYNFATTRFSCIIKGHVIDILYKLKLLLITLYHVIQLLLKLCKSFQLLNVQTKHYQ